MFVDLLYDTDCKREAQCLENVWRQKISAINRASLHNLFKCVLPFDIIENIFKFANNVIYIQDLKRTHHFINMSTPSVGRHIVYGYYIREYIKE
jgi:hypothetical protein